MPPRILYVARLKDKETSKNIAHILLTPIQKTNASSKTAFCKSFAASYPISGQQIDHNSGLNDQQFAAFWL